MKYLTIFFTLIVVIALGTVVYATYRTLSVPTGENPDIVACTADAKICPDGSAVGRVGPNCQFAECPVYTEEEASPEVPADVQAHIDSKADLIRLTTPEPFEYVQSPLEITGEARGMWYFEATFPITIVNWDGLIIAEGYAEAQGDWMTEEFVPFIATIEFTTPDYDERGTIILHKSNASGLPEHDDALEIPIRFESVQ